MKRIQSFKTKLYLLTFIPLVLCYFFYLAITTLYEYRAHEKNCEQVLQSQCKLLASLIEDLLDTEQFDKLTETIKKQNISESLFHITLLPLHQSLKIYFPEESPEIEVSKLPEEGYFYQEGKIGYVEPIKSQNINYGYICIWAYRNQFTYPFYSKILTTSLMTFFIFLFLFLTVRTTGSFFLLQLGNLTKILETILETKNFSLRTKMTPIDEIGVIGYYIDRLLEEIDEHLITLSSFHKLLEEQIKHHKVALSQESLARELAEKNLQMEELKFKDLVDNVNSIILRMKPDGTIIFVNRFAEEFFMYEKDELIGKNVIGTIVPPLDSNLRNLEEMILDIGKNPDKYKNNQNENVKKNGERVWISWTNKAIYDDTGNIIEILCVGNDLTEHKKMEKEIINAKQLLEEKNRELAKLVEEMKNLAMKAELANKAKTAFLAKMSHEIRTPLNGIIGILHLLSSGVKEASTKEFLDIALSNAEALLSLLNNLLELSRIEAGEVPIQKSLFSVKEVIEEIIQMFWYRAKEKNLMLTYSIKSTVPEYLIGDASKIRQILINLVGNAIKFTEEGEINITAELTEDTITNAKIKFKVSDTGKGLSTEDREKIFNAFERGKNAEEKRIDGVGLGLAICKQLTDLLGGKIDFECKEGEGTTFWFELTLDKPSESSTPKLGIKLNEVYLVSQNKELTEQIVKILSPLALKKLITTKNINEVIEKIKERSIVGEEILLLIDSSVLKDLASELMSSIRTIQTQTILIYPCNASVDDLEYFEKSLPNSKFIQFPIKTQEFINIISQPKPKTSFHLKENNFPLTEKRILLAEDNPVNQRVIYEFLARRGYQVDIASHSEEVLEKFLKNKYDLILMDIEMPGQNGYEITRKIREIEKDKGLQTPIIALTAYSFQEDKEKCIEAGMDDFLSKPVSPMNLIETVRKHLEKKSLISNEPYEVSEKEALTYDEEIALKRLNNDEELLKDAVNLFLEISPKYLSDAERAIRENNVGSFFIAMHTLKSSAYTVGGIKTGNLAKILEDKSRQVSSLEDPEIQQLFLELKNSLFELVSILRNKFQEK